MWGMDPCTAVESTTVRVWFTYSCKDGTKYKTLKI